MKRWRIVGATIAAATVGLTAFVPVIDGGGEPGELLAHIWIDANGGTCADSGALVEYSDAAACSPDQANDTCEAGDTVRVRGGPYGSVTLTGSNGRSSGECAFEEGGNGAYTGTSLVFSESDFLRWSVGAPWNPITKTGAPGTVLTPGSGQGMQVSATGTGVQNLTIEDMKVDGELADANFAMTAVSGNFANIVIQRTDFGNVTDRIIFQEDAVNGPGNGLTIRDNYWHDQVYSGQPDLHSEILLMNGMNNLTIERNVFKECISTGCMNWGISGTGDQTPSNYVFRNNVMVEINDANFTIQGCPNVSGTYDVSYNFFGDEPIRCDGGLDANKTMTGNLGNLQSCGDATYVKNQWTNVRCDGTSDNPANVTADDDALFADPANENYCPANGSALQVDKGSTSIFPAVDILGHARFIGAAPDVGPCEFGAS